MIRLTSVINEAQTIDSVALPAFATQKRASATAAVIAASDARTVYYAELGGEPNDDKFEFSYTQATGTTVALPDNAQIARFTHAADIAALTVQFPVNPRDQQELLMIFGQAVTTLTLQSGSGASQTLVGAGTAATDGSYQRYLYEEGGNTWTRVG